MMQTGEVLDAIDAKRQEVLDIARLEIGQKQGKGSPRVLVYWRAACPQLNEAQLRYACEHEDWCRVFCLWALKQAGLAESLRWEVGRGFEYHLPKLKPNQPALPGDICIWRRKWHGALFVGEDGHFITTIDGNQPGVCTRVRSSKPELFFSISGLIDEWLDLSSEEG